MQLFDFNSFRGIEKATRRTKDEVVAGDDMTGIIIICLLTLINVGILGLNLKLYTEYFKDRKIEKRKEAA